ncbi:MAG TPA: hypothetical protein VKR56_03000 [Candidatus Cybelea sp.]|nr:hypothetical protein [Candidatus Cybelea sp.]
MPRSRSLLLPLQAFAVAALLGGCDGAISTLQAPSAHVPSASSKKHSPGLGVVLTSQGGQIYGFDIDQSGSDGVLATAANVETFDENSGKITKSFPKKTPSGTSYGADGIFTGDVALITRYVVPKGKIYAKRFYDVMSPVTSGKFTGTWTPPLKDIQVEQAGPNQTAGDTAIFAIELKNQDVPELIVSNVAKNTFGKVIGLNPSGFSLGDQPQLGQDTETDQAVIASSPDGGRVGGEAPVNLLIDMKSGQQIEFNGLNNGPYGSGFVNGLAVDSATGIAATTTELNAQVEFYNLAKKTGTAVQLPCTGDASQSLSGSGVANDSTNGLFLVTEQYYCNGSQGSAIVVYDESGNLVETITGFTFFVGEGAPVINPSERMGWVFGPGVSQLQQFFY